MNEKCTSCGGPYHPSTGHILSEKSVLCGPCALDFKTWIRGMMSRKWGKQRFYDHVHTSANKTTEESVDKETTEAVQQEDGDEA